MAKPIAIVMDVDQVLLDYMSRFRDYFSTHHDIELRGMPDSWDMSPWVGIPSDKVLSVMNTFHKDWTFGCMDAFPGADVNLTKLKNMGYHLIYVTACGNEDITIALRRANLHAKFRDIFTEGYFVGFNQTKSEVLIDLNDRYDIHLFVDDKPENLDDALSVGINNVLLMKAPHNRDSRHRFESAFGWYDVMDVIKRQ